MAHIIYKYHVPFAREFVLRLPEFSKVLSMQTQQDDKLFVWVLHNNDHKIIEYTFALLCTGEEFEMSRYHNMQYISTAQLINGSTVLHLFLVEKQTT